MWAHLIGALLGVALMAAPSLAGYSGLAADVDHTLGPLATSIGLMAASQILRALRWGNLVIAILLVISSATLDRPGAATLAILLLAVGLGASALVRGQVDARFGGGWSTLMKAGGKGK